MTGPNKTLGGGSTVNDIPLGRKNVEDIRDFGASAGSDSTTGPCLDAGKRH